MIKVGRILTIIMWVLLLISGILVISLITSISENDQDAVMGNWISTNLTWSYILFAIAAGIIIVAGLYQMATDMNSLKSGLFVVAFFVIVIGIAYLFTSNTMPQFNGVDKFIADGTLTPKVSRMIGLGLNTTYILFILAIASVVWSSVSRLFK